MQTGDQPGMLELTFSRLHLADGTNYQINGVPASMDEKNVTTNSDGILVAKSTKDNKALKYAGIGAGCRSIGEYFRRR